MCMTKFDSVLCVYCVTFTCLIAVSDKFSINYLLVCLPAQKYLTHKSTGFLEFIKCREFWRERSISYAVSVLRWKSVEVTIWLVPVERVDLGHWFECSQPSRFLPTHLPEDRRKYTFQTLCIGWHTRWWEKSRNSIILSLHIMLLLLCSGIFPLMFNYCMWIFLLYW